MSDEPVQLHDSLTDDDALWMEYMRLEAAMHLAPAIEQAVHWEKLRAFHDALPVEKQLMLGERINQRYAHLPAVYTQTPQQLVQQRADAEFMADQRRMGQLVKVMATTHPDSDAFKAAEDELSEIGERIRPRYDAEMERLPFFKWCFVQLIAFTAWCARPIITTLNRWML